MTVQKPFVARLLAVAGLLLGACAAAVTGATPASAAACSSSTGVTVVVDYGSLGGTSVGCARSLGSGLDVLKNAGHSVTYVSPRQPGFVCTIDRRPDPCNGAPTTAYWSYWHATPGGSWSYSTVGAASSKPKSGTVEGWAFGAGKPPAVRPPARPRPAASSTTSPPTSRTTTSRPASTTKAGAAGSTSHTTAASGAPTAAAAPSTTAPTTPTDQGQSSPTTDGTPEALTATRTDAAVPTSATSPSGGAGSLVVAVLLVLVLAGGGGVIAWRRRRSGA